MEWIVGAFSFVLIGVAAKIVDVCLGDPVSHWLQRQGRSVSRLFSQKYQEDTFTFVNPRLTRVSYLKLSPPIDVQEADGNLLMSRIKPQKFRIPPPSDRDKIIRDVAVRIDGLEPGTEAFERRVEEYWRQTREVDCFAEDEEYNLEAGDPSDFFVFSQLLSDHETWESARRKVFEDSLTRSNSFHFNGQFLAICRFMETRTREERPALLIELQPTDYYTFRVISEVAHQLPERFGFDAESIAGPHLSNYFAAGFQKNIHASLGLAILVHTLQDNRMIITRRSPNTANPAGEAGKYFMSANEGSNDRDIDPNNRDRLCRLSDMIRRALDEELIGSKKGGLDLLPKIRDCYVTGVILYLPNMSINLCVDVAMDCTAEEIRRTYAFARDGRFESWIIQEDQWDRRSGLPAYSPQAINRLIKESVGNRPLPDVWDEGALVTVMLSTLVA